ncbi:MAG TPA: carboxypeptidase-like regulatory domain-containing protein [Luteibacter sp.]|jgi:hypothetical protein|nr:carboxypeptidase-like regulatory domain-containing protein [Luteibacter sp.]
MKNVYLPLMIAILVSNVALANQPTGYIAGAADPGAQIVVINDDTSAVSGFVATAKGTYRAGPLQPGRYSIVEAGEHHATRHLRVEANRDAAVDLAPSHSP